MCQAKALFKPKTFPTEPQTSDKSPPKDLLDWLGITNTPNWRVARPLGTIISVLLALLIFGAFVAAFTLLGRTIQGGFDTAAGNLGAGALIVAILGAPFLVWGTVIKQKTVTFQKESHITDRISKAVEQLGAEKTVKKDGDESTEPNIEVRIGGLLSLERIAQDSTEYDKGRDHVRVMEILCAYVRENAKASDAQDGSFPNDSHEGTLEAKIANSSYKWIHSLDKPRNDIQIALSILGRRSAEQLEIEAHHIGPKGRGYTLDLKETNLRKADLEYLNFANASFFRAKLEGAYCKGADLSGTNLIYANMTGVGGRKLNLQNARMESADFSYATLDEAQIINCEMSHTHFVGTQLQGAHLRFTDKPSLGTVNRAYFIHADLKAALIEGKPHAAIFQFRDHEDGKAPRGMHYVGFHDVDLFDQTFVFSEIVEATVFPAEHIEATFGDAAVTLHPDVSRPAHWPDWKLPSSGEPSFFTEWRKWQAAPRGYTPPPKPTD